MNKTCYYVTFYLMMILNSFFSFFFLFTACLSFDSYNTTSVISILFLVFIIIVFSGLVLYYILNMIGFMRTFFSKHRYICKYTFLLSLALLGIIILYDLLQMIIAVNFYALIFDFLFVLLIYVYYIIGKKGDKQISAMIILTQKQFSELKEEEDIDDKLREEMNKKGIEMSGIN